MDPLFARDVAGRIAAFVWRGGKRLRTAFARCGWRATGDPGDATALLRTGAALAGDLALTRGEGLLTETALGAPYSVRLHHEWQAMRREMVAGRYPGHPRAGGGRIRARGGVEHRHPQE